MSFETSYLEQEAKLKLPEDKRFWVWLSHDVDWVQKNILQAGYYTLQQKRPYHFFNWWSGKNNYWNFEAYKEVEDHYGARSTFFFLNESIQPRLSDRRSIALGYGRYDIHDPKVSQVIRELDQEGWEIGLHGSYYSYNNPDLLRREKNTLEGIVGHEVQGTRQHHLNMEIPETWQYHRRLGLRYDSSYGVKKKVGLPPEAPRPFRPFPDDEFTVFPVGLMDTYLLMQTSSKKEGERLIDEVLQETKKKRTILTVIWHQRSYNEKEFPLLYHWYNYLLWQTGEYGGAFVLPREVMKS